MGTDTKSSMDTSGNKKHEDQPDSTRGTSSGNQSKTGRQDQGGSGSPKDVDANRHPEEQVVKKAEFKNEDRKITDKSTRAYL